MSNYPHAPPHISISRSGEGEAKRYEEAIAATIKPAPPICPEAQKTTEF